MDRLPYRPYCTNNFESGITVRSKESACKMKYLQCNPPVFEQALVFDIDHSASVYSCMYSGVAYPNFMVVNPSNNHCHAIYVLDTPVTLTENASSKAIHYLEHIKSHYRSALKADSSYKGLLVKNPKHDAWVTLPGRSEAYDLHELSEWLHSDIVYNKIPFTDNQDSRALILFDQLRYWAYQNIDYYRAQCCDYESWYNVLLSKAEVYSSTFPSKDHLFRYSEVKSIVKSVAGWTWRRFHGKKESDRRFSTLQSARGQLKGKEKRDKFLSTILKLHSQGFSQREIAIRTQYNQSTISRLLRGYDAKP